MNAEISDAQLQRAYARIQLEEDIRAYKQTHKREFPIGWYPWQQDAFNSFKPQIMTLAANRSGKSQPNQELIPTPSGYTTMGEIAIGDFVFGSHGKPVKVTGVFPQGLRRIYEITFKDGSSARADGEHLWAVQRRYLTHTYKQEIRTTNELSNSLEIPTYPRPRAAVEFIEKELIVEPYLVGVLLGDGCITQATINVTTVDQQTIDYCAEQAKLWNCDLVNRNEIGYHFSTNMHRPNGTARNFLKDALMAIGIHGHGSHTKFVPDEYKFNSRRNRLAVLQGLMDTDGYISPKNRGRSFSSVSKVLAKDVQWLARSLGMSATLKIKKGVYRNKPHYSWRVNIHQHPISLFRLDRKRKHERFSKFKVARGTKIVSIKYVGAMEATCISVDAKDSLYLTKDFIPTHNTMSAGFQTACDMTGDYPEWWTGFKQTHAPYVLAMGVDNEQLKTVVQTELFGMVTEHKHFSGGWIHPDEIVRIEWSGQITGLARRITVKGKYGKSTVTLRAYSASKTGTASLSFAGANIDLIWIDECPPDDLVGQLVIRTMHGNLGRGGRLRYTLTPELGATGLVTDFMEDREDFQKLIGPVAWDECPHLSPEIQRQMLSSIPEHEREMRSKGVPFFGSGLVYPIAESRISIPDFKIPPYFRCIRAMDLGINHPTAIVWLAYDMESDTIYVVRTYSVKGENAATHAAAANAMWSFAPCVFPHDIDTTEKGSGKTIRKSDTGL